MVRPTDQETIATEKIACFPQSPKPWDRDGMSHGEAQGLARRQTEQGKITVDSLFCGFLWHKGTGEAV